MKRALCTIAASAALLSLSGTAGAEVPEVATGTLALVLPPAPPHVIATPVAPTDPSLARYIELHRSLAPTPDLRIGYPVSSIACCDPAGRKVY